MFDAYHAEALRRHCWTGLGTIFEFVEAIDVLRLQLAAANIEQRANHFSDHVAQERAAAHGEDEFLVVRGAREFGGVNFTFGGALFVVLFRIARVSRAS